MKIKNSEELDKLIEACKKISLTTMEFTPEELKVYEDTDPSGKSLKEPGTKGDLGKTPVTRGCLHYFPRALAAIAELSGIGAKKYSWKGWESVPDGINRYGDALGRHELRIEGDYSRRDPDTRVLEATAVAWNALARLELILRKAEGKAMRPGEWKEISPEEAKNLGMQ